MEIIDQLREAEVIIASCSTAVRPARRIGVSEQTFYPRHLQPLGAGQFPPGQCERLPSQPRIQCVAQSITEVESTEHCDREYDSGKGTHPPGSVEI